MVARDEDSAAEVDRLTQVEGRQHRGQRVRDGVPGYLVPLSAAGIPTVVFGPDGAGAHAVEEWVDLASVRACAEVLLATATAFCV